MWEKERKGKTYGRKCGEKRKYNKKKKKKPNFSVYKIGVITENIQRYLETVQSILTNHVTNQHEIWEEITQAVNAVGTAKRMCLR